MGKNRALFYGGIQWDELHRNGTNTFIQVNFAVNSGETTLTNVTDKSGFFGQNDIIVGQQLVAAGAFNSGTTITAVDTSANTIEVSDPAASTKTGVSGLARISPPKGQYFIETGSITLPSGVGPALFRASVHITGSEDDNYDPSYKKWAVVGQQSLSTSQGTPLSGHFAVYELTRVHSIIDNSTFSGYISSSNDQLLGEDEDMVLTSGRQAGLLTELSLSSSLPTTIDVETMTGVPFGGGFSHAGYQVALQEYYDDLRVGIYHTSSLVEGNADFINFTGSAIKSITTASLNGQNGVLIEIEGGEGGGDTFPYTGSAQITGSLGLTGSFEIESGSTKPFIVNADGQVQLFAHENSYNPTPLLGGIYFTSQSVFLGLED